jgi:hypothetical protein
VGRRPMRQAESGLGPCLRTLICERRVHMRPTSTASQESSPCGASHGVPSHRVGHPGEAGQGPSRR